MEPVVAGLVPREGLLQEFEGSHVDGAVGKHADQTHGDASVRSPEPSLGDHLLGGLHEERVASQTTFDSLAL